MADSSGAVAALDAENQKLVTLARSARARARGAEGAAVRDDMGRTYAAGSVELPSLRLSALQAAVAAAVSSGSDRLEAAVIHADRDVLSDDDAALVADLAPGVVLVVTADGTVRAIGRGTPSSADR
jgi:hypothetical protein